MTSSTGTSSERSTDERARLFAAILIGVIGPEVFIVQPGFVQGLVTQLGFGSQGAGYVASIEVWGITATTVLMTFFSHRFNWRIITAVSLLAMAVANALCIGVHDHAWFVALRFLAGAGAGGLVSLSFTTIGMTSSPDRNFGILIACVMFYGAAMLYLMPVAYAHTAMAGPLAFFAVFPLFGLPFVKALPRNGHAEAVAGPDAVNVPGRFQLSAVVAMFVYFTAQGVVWAYLFLIGTAAGLGEQQVATGLMLSQIAGVAGALLPAWAGHRYGHLRPLTIGILGGAGCLLFLFGQMSYAVYAIVVCLYNLLWNLTQPFLLGAMASFDRSGRLVAYAVAAQMLGLAIGPALAAATLVPGTYTNINKIGLVLFVLSWLAILPPVMVRRRLTTTA